MSASDAVRAREQGKRPTRPVPPPKVATFSKSKKVKPLDIAVMPVIEEPVVIEPDPVVVEPEPVTEGPE